MLKKLTKFLFLILDFPVGWSSVLGLVLLYKLWAANTLLKLPSPWIAFLYGALFMTVKVLYHSLILAEILVSQRIILFFKSIFLEIEFILLCLGAGFAFGLLSYLACALGYPLVDGQLAHIDYIIGFDWGHVFQWSKAQPIGAVLRSAYLSIPFQVIIFALWCGALHRKERLYEVFWILFVSAFVTGAIFGFFPALGPAHALGLDNSLAEVNPGLGRALADVISIRSGMNSSADIQRLNGIVAFPSFHTICAIVFIYGFRRSIVWWAIVLLNMLMLMSVPAFGGHYLIDVLVGIVVALTSISIVRICHRHGRAIQSPMS